MQINPKCILLKCIEVKHIIRGGGDVEQDKLTAKPQQTLRFECQKHLNGVRQT
jgi:hypothetical protein